jgi:DNA-binding response OmpR family regulator
VLFLTEERSSLAAALRDQARDRYKICEVLLNGQSPLSFIQYPPEPCVVVICHHDLAGVTQLVSEVRRYDASMPILLVTPEQNTDLLLRAYHAGANDCIASSISPALLLAKVRVWQRWSHVAARSIAAANVM